MAHSEQPHETVVDHEIPKIRYVFTLAIISLFAASVVLLALGFFETFRAIVEAFAHNEGHLIEELKLHFVEVIDVFLLATILYVMAAGFWQLVLGRSALAPWLKVDSVHDLEVMLLGVIVTLLGVTALASILSGEVGEGLLPFGATIAVIIGAIGFFMWASASRGGEGH